jgi:hypothetical protein
MKIISSDSRSMTLTVLKAGTNQPRHRPASLVLLIAAVRAASTQPHGQHFLFRKCQQAFTFIQLSIPVVSLQLHSRISYEQKKFGEHFYRPVLNRLSPCLQ